MIFKSVVLQYVRRYQDKVLLNPGSVGLPYETVPRGVDRNPLWAEYAIIDWRGASR